MLLVSAKNMCGIKNGVSNKILSENAKAFLTHCFGLVLNLAIGNMVKNVRFHNTTYKTSNLITKFSKGDKMLHKNRKDMLLKYPGFRVLCPTRWRVRTESMKSLLITGLLCHKFGMNHLIEAWNQKGRVELLV